MIPVVNRIGKRINLPEYNPAEPVDAVDWDDPEEVRLLKALVADDSPEGLSAWARHVCGYNYFKQPDPRTRKQVSVRARPTRIYRGVLWTCGIVDYGPHRQMAQAFLAPDDALIVCSRDSFKTHMAMAWLSRLIALNRDQCVIVYMQTMAEAEKTVDAIRNILESEAAVRLFGDFKGDSKRWKTDSFTVCGRSNPSERNPTCVAVGVDKFVTGAHGDVFYCDDPVSWQTARSRDQLEKAKEGYQASMPLMNPGFIQRITLTPYAPGDFCEWAVSELAMPRTFIPCGMVAGIDDQHQKTLTGSPTFPHLSSAHLAKILGSMSVSMFNRQFALKMDDADSLFRREDFVPARWDERMSRLSAYLMTDSATSKRDDACMSVLAWVLLDWDATAYIADMDIGRWRPTEFVDHAFAMIQRWQSRTIFRGMTIEKATLNDVYRDWMVKEATSRGVRLNFIPIARGGGLDSDKQPVHKQQRILGLEQYLRAHRIKFLDTIPRHFHDQGKIKLLYDPHGHQAPGQAAQPAGEIVDQFIHWKNTSSYKGLRDIPDCLADMHAVDPTNGQRLLSLPPRSYAAQPDLSRPAPQRAHAQRLRGDYWSRFATKT